MASTSGGTSQDWSNSIRPLLAASSGSFTYNDIPGLVKIIVLSEEEILTHEDIYESFYAPFVALSAHYICSNAQFLLKSQINSTCRACRVLLQYFLQSLKTCNEQSCLLQKQIMSLIKGLCRGAGYLQRSDVISLTAMIKSAKLPAHITAFTEEKEEMGSTVKRPRVDPATTILEQLMTPILDTTTKPKSHGRIEMVDKEVDQTIIHVTDLCEVVKSLFAKKNSLSLQQLNAGDVMIDECLALPQLLAYVIKCDEVFAGKPLQLPNCVTGAAAISNTFKGVMNDLSIVKNTLSLPIVEPLTDKRLMKLTKLTLSCLYAALNTTAAHSILNIAGTGPISKGSSGTSVLLAKEDDNDICVSTIVESALSIFNLTSTAIQVSTRAGGHNLQNLHLLASWMLLTGIQHIVNLGPSTIIDKSKENVKKTPEHSSTRSKEGGKQNITKLQQGFGVLCVAITNQALTLLVSLLDDLKVESGMSSSYNSSDSPAHLDILGHYTAWQRVLKLTTSLNLTSLLFNLASISYRKFSRHQDSNTYYSDEFSCSDGSLGKEGSNEREGSIGEDDSIGEGSIERDGSIAEESCPIEENAHDGYVSGRASGIVEEDDFSAPNLSGWFKEASSAPQDSRKACHSPNGDQNPLNSPSADVHLDGTYKYADSVIPVKGEPHGFICLAEKIFTFINDHMINSESYSVTQYFRQSLNEQHMVTISGIIRDLDRETARSEHGISMYFGAVFSSMYDDFSQSLSWFTHNLLATELLNDNLQNLLLNQLGVNPVQQAAKDDWPLQVYPRTLFILAQVLLIRQQREKEDLKNESQIAVVRIWTRLLNTLRNRILGSSPTNSSEDNDDINVEHMQLLLFLFQRLQLMQKKGILIHCAHTIIESVPVIDKNMQDMSIVHLSKLILIFEYFMRHLYDAPPQLLDQVQANLFNPQLCNPSSSSEAATPLDEEIKESPTDKSKDHNKLYFQCHEVENFYRKLVDEYDSSFNMKPRFYYLYSVEPIATLQDATKLDGLACSFILSTPELLKFSDLYKALMKIMSIISQCDMNSNKRPLLVNCAIHFCCIINWRLILSLPPCLEYLQLLSEENPGQLDYAQIIQSLIWLPRIVNKTLSSWTTDSLVKQGLTVHQSETLLKNIITKQGSIQYDLVLAKQIFNSLVGTNDPQMGRDSILPHTSIPKLKDVCLVDLILAKVQVSLDKLLNEDKVDMTIAKNVAQTMLPMVFQLIEYFASCARSTICHQLNVDEESCTRDSVLRSYNYVIQICSSRTNKIASNAKSHVPSLEDCMPSGLTSQLEQWNKCDLEEFPAYNSWRKLFESHKLPCESYVSELYMTHISTLSRQATFSLNSSLKHSLYMLVHFASEMIVWTTDDKIVTDLLRVMFPLLPDGIAENLTDFFVILKIVDLTWILLAALKPSLSPKFGTYIFKFLNKLLQQVEKDPKDKTLVKLCGTLSSLCKMESFQMKDWLNKMMLLDGSNCQLSLQENRLLFQNFTSYISSDTNRIPEDVSQMLLKCLIPLSTDLLSPTSDGSGASELMVAMANLAGAGTGSGHILLFKACISWLSTCKKFLIQQEVLSKLEKPDNAGGKHLTVMECVCYLMSYITDIVCALKQANDRPNVIVRPGISTPPCDTILHQIDVDSDGLEDLGQDDEDSAPEDSDDDSKCNKLCTFTVTQKEFMNQHWYHCHTCKMVDGVGVCTVCAKVCHKDHDVTYAKFGSFFCDCGAKADGSCVALVKKNTKLSIECPTSAPPVSSLRRKASISCTPSGNEDGHKVEEASKLRQKLMKQLETHRETMLNLLSSSDTVDTILEMIHSLMNAINLNCKKKSNIGNIVNAKQALDSLHNSTEKSFETSELLMVPTLGSQEGAFENVRMNYSGDQGQTIRQLINSHMVRRVAMCCLSSPFGRRQHLAVCHEKGKITVLQLSALLKQSDSSKRKLTLTRLASAPVPFTVLSITSNPCNEDFLAVCGLKDCHVLTFNSSGSVCDHLVLHPQLDTANYIIKAIWLPGSQTNLALVTSDFVKIYDLSRDALSPQYYFLLPSAKIRDCCFLFSDDGSKHLLLMCSAGNIYSQSMCVDSSAQHGPFYVTTILDVKHPDITDSNSGQVAGGGVSIYYSHALQLLFFSYAQGKSFLAPLKHIHADTCLDNLCTITFKPTVQVSSTKGCVMQPLCQWGEIPNHPGLVTSLTQSSNNPVILMVTPTTIYVQEIKCVIMTSFIFNQSEGRGGACYYVAYNSDVDYEPMESDNETIDSYESDDVDLSEHEDDGVMLSDSWKRISEIFSDCRPNSLLELVRNFSGVNPALNCNANNSVLDCFKKFITNDVIVLVVLSCDRIARSAGATPLVSPSKTKITDMVTLRHPSAMNGGHRTTLILLCEDGSLRIYMAGIDHTGFWFSPSTNGVDPSLPIIRKSSKKKKGNRSQLAKPGRSSGSVSFAVDYFEHADPLTDIEFGGNDILQVIFISLILKEYLKLLMIKCIAKKTAKLKSIKVYNTNQIKHRLNTSNLYIASTKPTSFTIDLINNDSSVVIVGVRILVGSQEVSLAPSFFEIIGRTQQMSAIMTRGRWFDFPLTHEESMTIDKKLTILFGASSSNVTMVDSIKVYGKAKEVFGWSEENDEYLNGNTPVPGTSSLSAPIASVEGDCFTSTPLPISCLDRLVGGALEVLDSILSLTDDKNVAKQDTIDIATELLTCPTSATIAQHAKMLLAVLHSNRTSYNNHKDQALLKSVCQFISKSNDVSCVDANTYLRMVITTRSVAISRPSNLIRFTENDDSSTPMGIKVEDIDGPASNLNTSGNECSNESQKFVFLLVELFWKLHSAQPQNPALAPVCQPPLTNIEMMVQALIDIIHAFTSYDLDNVQLASKMYVRMLLCPDATVSFACKQALIRVLKPKPRRRRVFIPSPPHCSTPGTQSTEKPTVPEEPQVMEVEQNSNINVSLHPSSQPPSVLKKLIYIIQIMYTNLEASQESSSSETEQQYEVVDHVEPMVLLSQENVSGHAVEGQHGAAAGSLEALFPPMLDIPPDADDETMVELAIALSLQDQPGQSAELNLQGLSSLAAQAQRASSLEGGHYSDSTASVGASDDEGSTAATDGSTLRTSPAEQGGSGAGSESGGSAVDSIITEQNVSGRSSAYGDNVVETGTTGARSETSSVGAPSSSLPQESDIMSSEVESCDVDTSKKLHTLRLMLLEKFLYYLPELRDVGGVRIIPFMQVILMLSSDVDVEEEKDRTCLDNLISVMISELNISSTEQEITKLVERKPSHEVQLVIMRLLSVMMSKSKAGTLKTSANDNCSSFISNSTANALLNSGVISFCLTALKALLKHWKNSGTTAPADSAKTGGSQSSVMSNLLKPLPSLSPAPDMSPFFLRQYVRGHANDVFEAYPQLLTEMVFRLPYQMKKIINPSSGSNSRDSLFDDSWYHYLCEYMMTQQTPFVRRQVRKLLLFICGSKDEYRHMRDLHSLKSHMNDIKLICHQGGYGYFTSTGRQSTICLPYDSLITLIEHVKACTEVATTRTSNWQKFCLEDNTVIPFLIQVSSLLDEGISPVILQLLQCAICGLKALNPTQPNSKSKKSDEQTTTDSAPPASTTVAVTTVVDETSKFDEAHCHALVVQVNQTIDRNLLRSFIQSFLLDSNQTSVRWQAHSIILSIFRNSPTSQQESLLDLLWKIWPLLSSYGRKAAQFVDLLGYFTLKMLPSQSARKTKEYVEKAVELLRTQNGVLANHPNANIYNSLLGLVEFDGFYLESDPCLVCNNPEVAFANVKLSAIKVDSRFTTTTQIVKLVGSHTISKITLRIADLKRTKMVRTINVYYNNRSVQAVVELKNKPAMWHKAKSCSLASGQTEVKIEFPLPIVACNLMVEYADFYENIQATSETLQCPRCSASVPANPGVCANCGENVFQCHKCRAINYDERDPFLCNACGFCKYAKFDYTLTAKSCSCATDPIENEEDRKKTVAAINGLLEKADRVYKQLIGNKSPLEALLMYINDRTVIDSRMIDNDGSGIAGTSTAPATHPGLASVSRAIQQLAQRYCGDCKSLFDELSKIIQKVLASRKELVDYDRQQKEHTKVYSATPVTAPAYQFETSVAVSRCYGCASAATEYCITLLRALATSAKYRQMLCTEGQLLRQLVEHNLRRGSLVARYEVRQLLCLLTRDNVKATYELNTLIMEKIATALKGQMTSPDLVSSIRHEMGLLATSVQKDDSCWEQKLRCVMKLFLLGVKINTPVVLESLTLPCLNILQSLIKPASSSASSAVAPTTVSLTTKKGKESKPVESSFKSPAVDVNVNVKRWLSGNSDHSYKSWKQRMAARQSNRITSDKPRDMSSMSKCEVRSRYLSEKYYMRWKTTIQNKKLGNNAINSLKIMDSSWLRSVMFCPSSRSGRQAACTVIESLCQVESRKKVIIDKLTKYLDDVGKSGESSAEFLALYHNLMKGNRWKYYAAVKGVLPYVGNLINKEIEQLTKLEESTLNSDLSQGYALKMLTELLSVFLEQENIKHNFKGRLVGTVLNGYLSLRKLVIQRTKLIDETQDKLLELLEGMTTGTESETRAFMSVCVETVKKYPEDDMRTPLFVFERLSSIIYPEDNDVGEFFMTLEKDPQQEDFLQGRMLGNPYSSSEPGLGPLMRDVKNKICQDCELVALLEDDSGMELLVNNKIISLDLPVKDVFKKIWCVDNADVEAMRVVYRMRGLLGDATEEFIETLDAKNREEVDNEEVYKMANVMSYCGGLEVMLKRLSAIENLSRGRSLLIVLLKLFCHCIKVKANRHKLADPAMKTIPIMLATLKLALVADAETVAGSPGGPTVTEQLLQVMEFVLVEACHNLSPTSYAEFTSILGDENDLKYVLENIVRTHNSLLPRLMRVVTFLTFDSSSKMQIIIDSFKPFLNFNKFDYEHTPNEKIQLECFCDFAAGIENNEHGNQLKDLIVKSGIVNDAIYYITMHAPSIKTVILTASDDWKEFVGKPALKYVLRILTGLSRKHKATQTLISADCVPIMHRLEQMSSNEHVGSLAENLMETLKDHQSVAHKIDQARRLTKSEKKKLAMAMREKELGALGMKTNEKGQVSIDESSILTDMDDLGDESGLVCVICREGYKFQPTKVLGIYTFTKRVNIDDCEGKTRQTSGHVTVSHFNVVHVDCHMAAVRLARGRDEWESAVLQNANTKCNSLLPLWGPQVLESSFASALARHNNNIQECTGYRDVGYNSTVHDLKLLFQRFCQEKSFSDESGGGGPESNMHLVPYLIHTALYVLNTTRSVTREERNLNAFLQATPDKWIENSFEVDSPYYWLVMCIIIFSREDWNQKKVTFLKRMLAMAHIRETLSPSATRLPDTQVKDYQTVYKRALLFFALVNGLYTIVFKSITVSAPSSTDSKAVAAPIGNWSPSLADFIRHNDQALMESTGRLLHIYQHEMLPCQSFAEFCDVVELLDVIPDPDKFLADVLSLIPS
ncbi:E3 ubiquitin-protein ligase UBR4 [Nymphon striatum]|nr:E3 ubiquitin-protein ligase UBR4 [Nymphon striatum]